MPTPLPSLSPRSAGAARGRHPATHPGARRRLGMDDMRLAQAHGLWLVAPAGTAAHAGIAARRRASTPGSRSTPACTARAWSPARPSLLAAAQGLRAGGRHHADDAPGPADEPDNPVTARQLVAFEAATGGPAGPRSVANSAGVLAWQGAHRDWARPASCSTAPTRAARHPICCSR